MFKDKCASKDNCVTIFTTWIKVKPTEIIDKSSIERRQMNQIRWHDRNINLIFNAWMSHNCRQHQPPLPLSLELNWAELVTYLFLIFPHIPMYGCFHLSSVAAFHQPTKLVGWTNNKRGELYMWMMEKKSIKLNKTDQKKETELNDKVIKWWESTDWEEKGAATLHGTDSLQFYCFRNENNSNKIEIYFDIYYLLSLGPAGIFSHCLVTMLKLLSSVVLAHYLSFMSTAACVHLFYTETKPSQSLQCEQSTNQKSLKEEKWTEAILQSVLNSVDSQEELTCKWKATMLGL